MKVILSNGGSEFATHIDHSLRLKVISDETLVKLVESGEYKGLTKLHELIDIGVLPPYDGDPSDPDYEVDRHAHANIVLRHSFAFAKRFAELTNGITFAWSLMVVYVNGPFIIQSDGERGTEWVFERDKVQWMWPHIEAGTPRFFSPAVNPMFGDPQLYFWEDALCAEPMGPFQSEKEAREDYKKCRPDGEKTLGEDPGKEDKS